MNKPTSFQKKQALQLWAELPEALPLTPGAIAYKHKGTTIDEDGIRICGSLPFIKSILSRLKPLLRYENTATRIGIAFSEICDKDTGAVIHGRFRCSIQVHERGDEAKHFNRMASRMAGQLTIL